MIKIWSVFIFLTLCGYEKHPTWTSKEGILFSM